MNDGNGNVRELVDDFLRSDMPLAEYLRGLDAALRDEVQAQCEEAQFLDSFLADLPAPKSERDRPQRIAGCELIAPIGDGAMGEVFRARQATLGRQVAVKLVRAELLGHGDFLARFRNEAQLLARLDHPGIVKVLTYGVEQDWHYIVMDLVPGVDLARALPDLRLEVAGPGAPAAYDRVARITAELLEALAYAHGLGVVHRDLKPSNVVLDEHGRPRLVDFGLAKAAHRDPASESGAQLLTMPGIVLGTLPYLSPEVAMHRPCRLETPDLWAAAVMLFQLLTGALPYAERERERLFAALAAPRWLDPRTLQVTVPAPLAAICRRALAPLEADRYASAQAFAADLRRFLAREPVEAQRYWTAQRVLRHVERNRLRYAAGAAAVGVVVATWLGGRALAARQRVGDEVLGLVQLDVDKQALRELATPATQTRELLASDELRPGERSALIAVLTLMEQRAQREYDTAIADIRRGGGAKTPRPLAASAALQMTGVQRASEAGAVLALPSTAGLIENAYPVLVVEDPDDATGVPVQIQALDPIGGPTLTLATGFTPLKKALPPGTYRIVVGDATAFGEMGRVLLAPEIVVLRPRLLPSQSVRASMVRVPAGTAVIGQVASTPFDAQHAVEHDEFFIDRTEVTCREYRAYCLATGAAIPHGWAQGYFPTWDDLPVIGVTPDQATAYAEWLGKRLPTAEEWQIAARGPEGRLFPWGDDAARLQELLGVGRDRSVPWFEGAHPVGTVDLDTSWCGVKDMYGNVDEWTASVFVESLDGMPFPVLPWTKRHGGGWKLPRNPELTLTLTSPGQPTQIDTGFRCAKSAHP